MEVAFMKRLFCCSIVLCLLFAVSCGDGDSSQKKTDKKVETAEIRLAKQNYKIFIIMDTTDVWSTGIRDGFKKTMDKLLLEKGARAEYEVFDTEVNPEKTPPIIKAIEEKPPDLLCMINYPDAFADEQITKKFTSSNYKFVSENCIPTESGTIKSWEKPGGNVTGVGVFLQQNSPIRLMKKINPKVKKLAFFSWSAMEKTNEWFEKEITRACTEEGIDLVEFRRGPHVEAEFEFLSEYGKKGSEYFIMIGISAFVHEDGSFADITKIEGEYIRKNVSIPVMTYDEVSIKIGYLAGTCVIWYDIGIQLAEKGILILGGKNPGDIPWDYPRKYNIILNFQSAKDLRIEIPQEIVNAAYRIYTDYNGKYIGQP
jgi:putative ABC transport system substrate-binding protein